MFTDFCLVIDYASFFVIFQICKCIKDTNILKQKNKV